MAIDTQNSYAEIRYMIIGSSCEGCHPVGHQNIILKIGGVHSGIRTRLLLVDLI